MFASNTSQVSSDAVYVEDVFSTYLFTATGSLGLSVPNGIDLAAKGGLVWEKCRNTALDHSLADTARGGSKYSTSNDANAETTLSSGYEYVFGSSGYTNNRQYVSGRTYVSWTFRKQKKFFDVVTYTGDGASQRQISHNLTSTPGFIIVKRTDSTGNWWVAARTETGFAEFWGNSAGLNLTAAANATGTGITGPLGTSTYFQPTWNATAFTNINGATYVAYLFAHNAGGFGLTGTDNVISCGSYTTDGSGNATISLGYEPQWVLIKNSGTTSNWVITDNMRGMPVTTTDATLRPNTNDDEVFVNTLNPTATGFEVAGQAASNSFIYIAIRRGPMKTPTSGLSVFTPLSYSGSGGATPRKLTTTPGVIDVVIGRGPTDNSASTGVYDRLRGSGIGLRSNLSNAEANPSSYGYDVMFDTNGGYLVGQPWSTYLNYVGYPAVGWSFQRAPSFMDVVCFQFAGTSNTNRRVTHSLGVVPELWIMKRRSSADSWYGYHSALGKNTYFILNDNSQPTTSTNCWGTANPTTTDFGVNESLFSSGSDTNVVYLFASCPGVSKVGSYTGSGTTKQIDCGFTGGARFVLIKRTDSTGDWYVWDTARGIVSGNDPYLLLNSSAAEVTSTDYIDAYSAGFEISSTAPAAINASGGTFIYLAIS